MRLEQTDGRRQKLTTVVDITVSQVTLTNEQCLKLHKHAIEGINNNNTQ